jgi:hypothetical protein
MECRKTRAGPYGTGSGKKSDKRFSLHCIIVAGIGATLLRRRTKKMPPSDRKAAPMAAGFSRLVFHSPRARAEFSAARSRLSTDGISPSL